MKELKILGVGNSFSVDTMQHLASTALGCGVEKITLGNLYIGGCPIELHMENAENDLPAYTYYQNDGSGWVSVPEYKISDALKQTEWDHIFIQHGSKNGNRYTLEKCYKRLPELVNYLHTNAPGTPKISFNMTWCDDVGSTRPEPVFYNHDQLLFLERLIGIIKSHVLTVPGIYRVVPTGMAIQDLRAGGRNEMTRDGYHMSYGFGRYAASLAFLRGLTDIDVTGVSWRPEDVTEAEKNAAVKAADTAREHPFEIIPVTVEEP